MRTNPDDPIAYVDRTMPGLTKREEFALAFAKELIGTHPDIGDESARNAVARIAFQMADDFIDASNK